MKIIAANFKTNHTRKSTNVFVNNINTFLEDENISNDVYIFPPATALDNFDTKSNLIVGAQNAYCVKNGSFTGEIGTEQLEEFDIKTILIGHSERRHVLGESQKEIALKYNYYKALGYRIVYCVGEPLEVKQSGLTETLGYIWEQFDGIDLDYDNLVLAYEPVWAIGTGVVAEIEDIRTIHKKIKKKIQKPLLYGGSVKPANLSDILDIPNVDGALIGTASWIEEDFKTMIKISKDK
ncbi:MAG: triose-phosphate isomerase [Campylobacteraceae bacterium]|nr:triose-phosphate isomerase [Campylobacteraceae bacterium]MBT6107922.1 triose-phosphate isomerase [Campylobacteraceae bacterium]